MLAVRLDSLVAGMSRAELEFMESGAARHASAVPLSRSAELLKQFPATIAAAALETAAPLAVREAASKGAGPGPLCAIAMLAVAVAAALSGVPDGGVGEAAAARVADGSLRFDGGSTDAGRVQILHDGRWGTVCAADEGRRDAAAVACRQLGFGAATGTMVMPTAAGADEPMWLSHLRCRGDERSLSACSHAGWAGDGAAAAGGAGARPPCTYALGVRCLA